MRHLFMLTTRLLFLAMSMSMASVAVADASNSVHVVHEREHAGQVVYLRANLPGNRTISIDYGGGIFVWDGGSLRQISVSRRFPFRTKTAAYLGERKFVAVGSGTEDFVAILDLDSDAPPRVGGRMEGETLSFSDTLAGGGVRAAVVNAKATRVVEIDPSGSMKEIYRTSIDALTAVALSEDGRKLALATSGSDLMVIDIEQGHTVWARKTDAIITSLALRQSSGALIGSYDSTVAYKLKRIDQFELSTGATVRTIPAPCAVFQVDIPAHDRGFAICGKSLVDGLKIKNDIHTSFLDWKLSTTTSPVQVAIIPGVEVSYLPFRAGVTFSPTSQKFLIGGGDGTLFAEDVASTPRRGQITRLAPIPQVTSRMLVSRSGARVFSISSLFARNGRVDDKRAIDRTNVIEALSTAFGNSRPSPMQMEEAFPDLGIKITPNRLTSWDVAGAFNLGAVNSEVGRIEDAQFGPGGTTVVEAVDLVPNPPLETATFVLSTVSEEDGTLVNRRLISIDSVTGLLKEGAILTEAPTHHFELSQCFTIGINIRAHLAADSSALVLTCPVARLPDQNTKVPPTTPLNFDLLTYPIDPRGTIKNARISLPGTPESVELSRDGSLVAVLTETRIGNPMVDADKGDHSLVIVDTQQSKIRHRFDGALQSPVGKALAFSSDGSHLYVAQGLRVIEYNSNSGTARPIDIKPPILVSQISAIALSDNDRTLAISRHDGSTEVVDVDTTVVLRQIRHPGETAIEIEFAPGREDRLFEAMMSGGIALFDDEHEQRLADLLSYESGDWMVVAPSGLFSASIGGELGVTVTDGRRAVSVDQLYDAYFRPDLVRESIKTGAVEAVPDSKVNEALRHPPPEVQAALIRPSATQAQADISIRDAGGGIGGLRVFHNGKLTLDLDAAQLQTLARSAAKSAAGQTSITIPLPVASGENEYFIAGLNATGSTQSRFSKLSFAVEPSSLAPRHAYVMIIATKTFSTPKFEVVNTAESSALQLGQAFERVFASIVGADNVSEINLAGPSSSFASVEKSIKELESKTKPDDLVAIVITTHGEVLPSGEFVAALADTDASYTRALTGGRLLASMEKSRALTQVLVLDICHAGAVSEQAAAVYQERFAAFSGKAGIHILAATTSEARALPAYGTTTPFAYFLIEGLSNGPEHPGSRRSLRSIANDAAHQVTVAANRIGFSQVPFVYSFGSDLRFP
jgi:WD40 repeat protein